MEMKLIEVGIDSMEGKSIISSARSDSESSRATSAQEFAFTPELIRIGAGEDILLKLISVSDSRNCIVFVNSAQGSMSLVTLHHGNEIWTYEGYFEIMTFSGFVYPTDTNRLLPSEWSLSMSAARADGSQFGGKISDSIETATETLIHVWLIPPNTPLSRPSEMIKGTIGEARGETTSNGAATT